MEPVQTGSWRCFVTANEISPPISPTPSTSPASPTLYSTSYKQGDDILQELLYANNADLFAGIITEGEGNESNPFLTSEGQGILIAAPNAVGSFRQPFVPPPPPRYSASPVDRTLNISPASSSDFDWEEEQSLNLELLDTLTPASMSPMIDDVCPQIPMDIGDQQGSTFVNQPSSPVASVIVQNPNYELDFETKFQDIVRDLNLVERQVQVIPSEVIDAAELRELGMQELDLLSPDSLMESDEDSQISSSGNSSVGSPAVGQEIIVYTTDDSQSSQPFVLENSISLNDKDNIFLSISQPSSVSGSDAEDDTQELILDTLLEGNIKKAQVFASGLGQSSGRLSSPTAGTSKTKETALNALLTAVIKPERRGRKPSSANVEGKTWINLTDKALRKKEQNKTAATRYRQKKKLEALKCMEQQQLLVRDNEELRKKQQELLQELSIVKKLLRQRLAVPKRIGSSR